jgi:hypothetical protein
LACEEGAEDAAVAAAAEPMVPEPESQKNATTQVAAEDADEVVEGWPREDQATAAPSVVFPSQIEDVEELQTRLEMALTRVEALEARLREGERQRNGQMPHSDSSGQRSPDILEDTLPTALPFPHSGYIAGSMGHHLSAALAPVHVPIQRRPFVFEEFRRANSPGLQSERLRVIAPPDHLPMWGMPKKR